MDTNRKLVGAVPLSFERLLAALAVGVGLVTFGISETTNSPALGMLIGVVALFGFAGLVLYEVGRLLDEDGSDS